MKLEFSIFVYFIIFTKDLRIYFIFLSALSRSLLAFQLQNPAHGNQRAAVGLPRPKALHNGIDKRLFILRHISYLPVHRPGRRPRHRRGRPPGRPHRQSVHHRRQ